MFLSILLIYLSFSNGISALSEVGGIDSERTPKDALNGLQEVFQVQAPPRKSYNGASCQQVILQHEFASYGSPFVGYYTPPEDCTFTTTIFNVSVVSQGINYDRLGVLFFGDIEIWRMTTAMPTRTGIFWNFQKDMTIFDTLLRSEQKVIMSMDNIVDSVFTAPYNVTITALYYNDHKTLTPADVILPISTRSSSQNTSSVISLPDGNGTVFLSFPRNAERAVVSILASGNGDEEFWYTNVPTEYADTFNNTAIYGYSPFREVQLLIDGELAGVSWPFPVVFTGGISPGLWVPIVGIDTYDLPSFEIDVSPWLGVLCDGNQHEFQLKVVGYDSETMLGTVGSDWLVSGAVFLWVDEKGNQTTGTLVRSIPSDPTFEFTPLITANASSNTSLWIDLRARRTLSHSAIITTSSGDRTLSWTQSLYYTNIQNFTASGYNETLYQCTEGTSVFSPSSPYHAPVTASFSYPISFYQANVIPTDFLTTNSTLIAFLDRSLLSSSTPILPYLTLPSSFSVPEVLATRQNGSSTYFWNNTYYEYAGGIDPARGSSGETEQWYSYSGPRERGMEVYGRHVKAIDGYEPVLVLDETFERAIEVPATEAVNGGVMTN